MPALRCPTIATLRSPSSVADSPSSRSGSLATIASRRSAMPISNFADTRHRRPESELEALVGARSRASRDRPCSRRAGSACRSASGTRRPRDRDRVSPSWTSTRKMTRSAATTAALICCSTCVRQVGAVDDPDSARVDDVERAAFVLHDRRHAVARHARRRVDDRDPLAAQRVEQRRLADVRPADDRDGGALHICPASLWTCGITRTSRWILSAACCRCSARAGDGARFTAPHGDAG